MGRAPKAKLNVQWLAPENGANVPGYMTTPFPPDDDGPARVRFSVRFDQTEHLQLKLVTWFWNEVDAVTGKKRKWTWKVSSVIERLVRAQLDGFWNQIGAEVDDSHSQREERLKKILEKLKKDEQAKKATKK